MTHLPIVRQKIADKLTEEAMSLQSNPRAELENIREHNPIIHSYIQANILLAKIYGKDNIMMESVMLSALTGLYSLLDMQALENELDKNLT